MINPQHMQNNNTQGGDLVTPLSGIYIHIPFCEGKCPYCDFYSVAANDSLMDAYLESTLRALRHAPGIGAVDTVYFGGGTPSLMGAARLSRLLDAVDARYSPSSGSEITLEANPGTLSEELLKSLSKVGFNRVSIGAQSSQSAELALLGRRHDFHAVRDAVNWASKSGFRHISLDLMAALPGQSEKSLAQSIDDMARLPIDHLSVYLLKREEGTAFYSRYSDADPDMAADLYLCAVSRLEELGFRQYEISNFARTGGESRHNLKYWTLAPYLGLGPSAHSFTGGRRAFFGRSLMDYISAGDPFSLWQDDGPGGGGEEYLMLGLRLRRGISIKAADELGLDTSLLAKRARPLIRAGYLLDSGDNISLTPKGFLVSNSIIANLLGA